MKQYVVTSTQFTGEMLFEFDAQGLIICFDIRKAILSPAQYRGLMQRLPGDEDNLLKWVDSNKTLKSIIVPQDLSFDNFWNTYAYKVGDLAKAKKLWKALSDPDKAKALSAIHRYRVFAKDKGIDMVYPERYLSQQRYLNSF